MKNKTKIPHHQNRSKIQSGVNIAQILYLCNGLLQIKIITSQTNNLDTDQEIKVN